MNDELRMFSAGLLRLFFQRNVSGEHPYLLTGSIDRSRVWVFVRKVLVLLRNWTRLDKTGKNTLKQATNLISSYVALGVISTCNTLSGGGVTWMYPILFSFLCVITCVCLSLVIVGNSVHALISQAAIVPEYNAQ